MSDPNQLANTVATAGSPAPSRLCLGAADFGSKITADESFAVLDAFAEHGGNFLDSAHIYAAWLENGWGVSERTIGAWMRARACRAQIVVGTKGGHPILDADTTTGRLAAADIEQDLTESLERLGTDYIDVYWLHRDEPSRPIAEIVDTMTALVRSRRIRCWGVSNWSRERIDAARAYAADTQKLPPVANQPGWSLTKAEGPNPSRMGTVRMDTAWCAWHTETQLPVCPFSSSAGGFFGEENVAWARGGFTGDAPKSSGRDTPANRQRLVRAIALAEKKGCSANQIAFAWLLGQPFPVYPIFSTRHPAHAIDALAATQVGLSEEERDGLVDEG
jgi:aryl-alcohol dehydrogenase-like predicted oxidoreductase